MLNLGMGLTDLCKVHSGVDSDLPDDAFDLAAFELKMRAAQPKIIAFTSKNAAQAFLKTPVAYGEQSVTLGASRLFVLTSPSGLATRFFDIEIWRDLATEFSRI